MSLWSVAGRIVSTPVSPLTSNVRGPALTAEHLHPVRGADCDHIASGTTGRGPDRRCRRHARAVGAVERDTSVAAAGQAELPDRALGARADAQPQVAVRARRAARCRSCRVGEDGVGPRLDLRVGAGRGLHRRLADEIHRRPCRPALHDVGRGPGCDPGGGGRAAAALRQRHPAVLGLDDEAGRVDHVELAAGPVEQERAVRKWHHAEVGRLLSAHLSVRIDEAHGGPAVCEVDRDRGPLVAEEHRAVEQIEGMRLVGLHGDRGDRDRAGHERQARDHGDRLPTARRQAAGGGGVGTERGGVATTTGHGVLHLVATSGLV